MSYIIGLTPICGTIIVVWFWFRYENIKFKIRQIPKLILNNLGKNVLIFIVIVYEIIFLFFIIPRANDGFPQVNPRTTNAIKSLFCVDLSYKILITEPEKPELDYEEIYWRDLNKVHLEGANLISTVLKRADIRLAHLQKANMNRAILAEVNLKGADLREANLFQADLREVRNLTVEQLSKV